ncbi:uncharacterized protein LOC126901745 isoform X2 [Daktulosphaira vitifoliae]|uniref:uncharacterized protein LOC126901745 isoform X2 n=1 Tax=Daktulosphaira vitifoliae TaxID=58002 RepID=UPI0021AB04F7|nr:uncharacterized protein LOC126901745 isoform X2 [Daktulosphaira vitifoliae]
MNLICQLFIYCSFIVIHTNAVLDLQILTVVAQKMSRTNGLLYNIYQTGKAVEVLADYFDNNTYDTIVHYFLREEYDQLTRNDSDVQEIPQSEETLDAYDMKEEKIFNDYASYNREVWDRKIIMEKIFHNYFNYKVDMSSNLMCQNNENKLCEIIALLRSTHISVKIFEFQPTCDNGLCNISRYNMQDINPSEKILFGIVPTIFVQLENKTIQVDTSSQINLGVYNFTTNE